MKDAEIAIEMLNCAHRRVKSGQRCEEFMRHVLFYSPQYIGLARKAQREYATARMLLQAARRVHPATTPKAPKRARPVPPKMGPAVTASNARTVRRLLASVPFHGPSSDLLGKQIIYFTNPSGPIWIRDRFLGDKK